MTVVIKAALEDIERVAKLMILLWPENDLSEMMEETREKLEKRQTAYFLKIVQNEAVGFAQCQLRHDYVEGTECSPVGYLEGIFVQKDFRSKGYAKELLRSCEEWAAKQGCTEFASDCELNNVDSIRFHVRTGFEEANRIVCFVKKLD